MAYHVVGSDGRDGDRHRHRRPDAGLNITEVRITGSNQDDPLFNAQGQERGAGRDVRSGSGTDGGGGGSLEDGEGPDASTTDDLGLPLPGKAV